MAVAAAKMLDAMRAFGVPIPDAKTAVAAYRSALADCPADLVGSAFERATHSHRYGMRLPLPSELLDAVRDEAHERRRLVARLELMRLAPVDDDQPAQLGADQRAKNLALLAEARRILGTPR